MTYLRTKDRLQPLFRSWKHHERHEDGRIQAPLSFTIPLSPNPFTLLRDATPVSPDWDVPSSPWTHHLLQYKKTNLRMGYKRMTRARVKLMQAIRRDHKLPPISLGGEQQQVTTRFEQQQVNNNNKILCTQYPSTRCSTHFFFPARLGNPYEGIICCPM
jgi:hypothetical protein